MGTTYEEDVVAWSKEQAALLRVGQLADIDREHIAEEIEDVGKSEQRALASRMAVLLAHLLKWKYQANRRGASWRSIITVQRKDIAYLLAESPSLQVKFEDGLWFEIIWGKAVAQATAETNLDSFPETCPWSIEQILSTKFYPD